MFFYEICQIFKKTYFEEHLQITASICFSSKYYVTNSSDEFGLDETLAECKVSIFFKRNNFIQSNVVKWFICKLKKVSLAFQLRFFFNFWLSTLFKF